MALSRIDTTNMIEDVPQSKLDNNINFRNIIINGDMSIAQRGTSTASVSSGATFPALDRFKFYVVSGGTWTVSQDTDVPSGQGFAKSLKMDNTTANGSLSSGSLAQIQQGIEGQNLQYLKKGTSNAESVTLSFWVKSNKTGTYICEIRDTDNSRSISKSYTVSSASTWEKKTITFDGDTTGTLNNDNDKSFELVWWLLGGTDFTSGTLQTSWGSQTNANRAVGQVNLADSTSNEWYITGVQLEAGTTASDFEFLPVDVNLARCQRYFNRPINGSGQGICTAGAYNSSDAFGIYIFPVKMRTTPSLETTSGSSYYNFIGNNTGTSFNGPLVLSTGTESSAQIAFSSFGGALTQGVAGAFRSANASSSVAFSAEL
tara:strand:+ start:431 stop:1549 length:1119 start_codon:yes stop_codon:yes gene_type:complete